MSNDLLTPSERSAQMARIKKRDTGPEIRVRQALHSMGLRFRLHRADLPGTPDIVLPSRRVALLVHGCFWHQHPNCKLARMPKSRSDYWKPKLSRNVERDLEAARALSALGWSALIIWECETRNRQRLQARLSELLEITI